MASLAYYLVLFMYLHACSARLLLESDNDALQSKESSRQGLSIVGHLDNHKFPSLEERENIGGKKIRVSYSGKTLSHATGLEKSKRAEPLMLESWKKNDEKTEKIDVMDYAQPHHKPPIHNKGT